MVVVQAVGWLRLDVRKPSQKPGGDSTLAPFGVDLFLAIAVAHVRPEKLRKQLQNWSFAQVLLMNILTHQCWW
jgi:hypothetical protein